MCDRLRISICGVLLSALGGVALADVPYGFSSRDIGDEGLPGSASVSDNIWTVQGSGPDIGGQADDFHFYYYPYCDSPSSLHFEFVARIVSISDGSPEWARAGIMVRQTLDDDSDHVFVSLANNTPAGPTVLFQWRSVAGGDTKQVESVLTGYTPGDPLWLKIELRDETLTGFISSDDETWIEIGSCTDVLVSPLYVGLAVTSHDSTELVTATFDDVILLSRIPGPSCWASCVLPRHWDYVYPEYHEDDIYLLLHYYPGPMAEGYWVRGYFSDDKSDVDGRNPANCLGIVPPWPDVDEYAFVVGYDDPAIPEFAREPLRPETKYYWCIDSWDGTQYWLGPTWVFVTRDFPPASESAWDPNPEDRREWVPHEGTMTWKRNSVDTEGYILSYDIYIGTDHNDVNSATTASPQYIANVATENYDYQIYADGPHFWRVDTVLSLARPPFTKTYYIGNVWSFFPSPMWQISWRPDFHPDYIIDFKDYALFAADWHKTGAGLQMDISKNYKVNYNDLRVVAGFWLWQGP